MKYSGTFQVVDQCTKEVKFEGDFIINLIVDCQEDGYRMVGEIAHKLKGSKSYVCSVLKFGMDAYETAESLVRESLENIYDDAGVSCSVLITEVI